LWSAPQPAHCANSADRNVKKRIGYGSAHHSASSHTSGDRATGSSNCEQSLAHGCLLHISVESPRPPKISLPNLNNSGRPLGHQEAFAYLNLTNASLFVGWAEAGRAGAQGDDDYDVIGRRGLVIGRIFKATTSPVGNAMDVDARLRASAGPNADARI
jgi:hypothetical protein